MKAIFSALLSQLNRGEDAVLATMIAHAGSVPRGQGTQMLLAGEGILTGTVGGGVAEKTMKEFGLDLLRKKACGEHTYALHGGEGEKLGSVCGGAITVYFQYIAAHDGAWRALCEMMLDRIERRVGGWLMLPLKGGAPALLDEKKQTLCGEEARNWEALCRFVSVRTEEYFAMPLYVGERAVLFGAGHCAQALTPVLASVGFRVTVYDDREALARRELFPQAERVICAPYEDIDERIALDEEDYVVAMTSAHTSDLCVQKQVLRGEHAYVGMLGSRAKREFVNGKLLQCGISQAMIDKVHTPIGLMIGAVTPAEIAISIAGEMISERAERRRKRAEE